MTTCEASETSTGTRPRSGRALVRRHLAMHRRDLVVGSLLVMTHQLAESLVPVTIGLAVDRAIETGSVPALARWVGATIALFVVLALAAMAGYYRLDRATQAVSHDLRGEVVRRSVDPRGSAGEHLVGRTVSLATSDADRVGLAAEAVGITAGALAALGGGGLLLVVISWQLGVVVLVGLPVVVVFASGLSAPLEGRSEREQVSMATAAGVATDLVIGLRVLKGLGAESAASARYRTTSRRALDGRVHAATFLGAYEAATLAVAGLFLVVVTAVGGRLATSGSITVGELIAAVGLAQFLVGPLTRLAGIGPTRARARASAARIADFLGAAPAVQDSTSPRAGRASGVQFDHVDSGSLADLDLVVDEGEWLGVVADPAHAHDLIDLLARRCDPQRGTVRLGGIALSSWSLDDLRRDVVVADHEALLLSGSVIDNVLAAVPDQRPDDPQVAAVLRATTVDEVLESLPDGAATQVGEDGSRVSGGQRQRILLARAVATAAPVLVLHDPTTAVDAATDLLVVDRVRALRPDRTTIVVTTDPTWLARCDRVVVVRDGRVHRDGAHHELVSGDEWYRQVVS